MNLHVLIVLIVKPIAVNLEVSMNVFLSCDTGEAEAVLGIPALYFRVKKPFRPFFCLPRSDELVFEGPSDSGSATTVRSDIEPLSWFEAKGG